MKQALYGRTLAALLLGGLLLGACGGSGNTSTSTPTSTLGTDSAATKVGGMPTDTAGTANNMGGVMPAPKGGTGPSGNTNGTGAN
ncbi:MAG: hypothetical protein EOO59_14555 [Hymenobacter sp.]|nr:MAG: hypothetical protein EOO59_14555 [Hymenobacter sp.]